MPQVPIPNMARQVFAPSTQGPGVPQTAQVPQVPLQLSQQMAQTLSQAGDQLVAIGAKVRSERDYSDAKAAHLDISDYILQQEIEYAELDPREQRGAAKKFQSNVESFIEQKMKSLGSDQARGMLKTPAGQSQLRFKEWSLTQELKAEKAHQTGLMVATGQNLIAKAARAFLSPAADRMVVDAVDAMQSPGGENTGESTRQLRQDDRSEYQATLDAYLTNLEELADQQTTSPQQREAFIRNGTTEFYQGVVDVMLAQDPPRYEQAKKLLEAVPATSLSPKGKAEMLSNIRSIGATEKRKQIEQSSLDLAFNVLDQAQSELTTQQFAGDTVSDDVQARMAPGSILFEESLASGDKVYVRARAKLESQARNGTISAAKFTAALKNLDREHAATQARFQVEAADLLTQASQQSPGATSYDELEPGLASAIKRNPAARAAIEGRAQLKTANNVRSAMQAASALNPQAYSFPANAQAAASFDIENKRRLHRQEVKSLIRDARNFRSIPGIPRDPETKQIIQEQVVPFLKNRYFATVDEADVQKIVNGIEALTVGAEVGDKDKIRSLAKLAVLNLGDVAIFRGTTKEGEVERTVNPVVASLAGDYLIRWMADHPEVDKLDQAKANEVIRSSQELSSMFFDVATGKVGEYNNDDGDVRVPIWAMSASQVMTELKAGNTGKLILDIGDGKTMPVGEVGQAFLRRIKIGKAEDLKKLTGPPANMDPDVAAYKYIQGLFDDLDAAGMFDFSASSYSSEQDALDLIENAKVARKLVKNADQYVDLLSENWSPEVVASMMGAIDTDTGLFRGPPTGLMLDQARKRIRENVPDTSRHEDLFAELGRYATAVSLKSPGNWSLPQKEQAAIGMRDAYEALIEVVEQEKKSLEELKNRRVVKLDVLNEGYQRVRDAQKNADVLNEQLKGIYRSVIRLDERKLLQQDEEARAAAWYDVTKKMPPTSKLMRFKYEEWRDTLGGRSKKPGVTYQSAEDKRLAARKRESN